LMPLMKVSDIELKWADEELVKQRIFENGFDHDSAFESITHSDRTTHVYEGGFKIWECCFDLCQLVDEESANIHGKRVLELGCGAGLPAILCARRDATHVTLHDFNDCVIQCFTKENMRLNDVEKSKYNLISGSWTDFPSTIEPRSFDLILTSETIYNPDDYVALHDAFDHALSPDGMIWVAAKTFYFGVGGDIATFTEFIAKKGVFKVTTKRLFNAEIPRVVLELRR
uniref:protein-histidine N-methyltransferase n=1 Tax=Haemonchus contortus TaxID=6289 RepID=A0A7I4YCD4_HAECO